MDLLHHCLQRNWRRVAFIGTTKHAGKTTALNSFILQATDAGLTVGLCSVGLDGERLDTILSVEKPAIDAPAGTVVVSAEHALEQSDAKFEWLEELPVSSPLGALMVARVTTPGRVLLAGVRERAHVQMIMHCLQRYGVDFCLVDGAFDRVAAAAPHLVDAAVLAVSAVAGRTVEAAARHAQEFVARFQLPQACPEWKQAFASVRDRAVIGLLTSTGVTELPPHQGVFGLTAHPDWSRGVRAVYLPGALTERVVAELRCHPAPLDVVVGHPAQVTVSGDNLRTLLRAGHGVYVWDPMPIAAVAVNPHHIRGHDFPRQEFLRAVQDAVGEIPVYDAQHAQGSVIT